MLRTDSCVDIFLLAWKKCVSDRQSVHMLNVNVVLGRVTMKVSAQVRISIISRAIFYPSTGHSMMHYH